MILSYLELAETNITVFKQPGKTGIALTPGEQHQIIVFLKTLTDIDFINDRRFNNH